MGGLHLFVCLLALTTSDRLTRVPTNLAFRRPSCPLLAESGFLDPAELGADLKDLAFGGAEVPAQQPQSQQQQQQHKPPAHSSQPPQIGFQDFLLAYFAARGRQIQHLGGGQAVYEGLFQVSAGLRLRLFLICVRVCVLNVCCVCC